MNETSAILSVSGLSLSIGKSPILRDLDLALHRGQCLGLIGESGSGKSMTALAIMGLAPRRAAIDGEAALQGAGNLIEKSPGEMAAIRGHRIAMVFQEPMTALNPLQTIGAQIAEPMAIRGNLSTGERQERVAALMDDVGLDPKRVTPKSYPHQMSGGQRQRAMIAMALAMDPDVLIADEPTTALDVSVQADVLDLLDRVIVGRNKALMLITHDLGVVARACDEVAVMYAGRIVEQAPVKRLLSQMAHPYTHALMNSLPSRNAPGQPLPTIEGQVAKPKRDDVGCAFAPRCDFATGQCAQTRPGLTNGVACHFPLSAQDNAA